MLTYYSESSFSESIGVLFSYSMAKRKQDDSFYIHPLIHIWARDREGIDSQKSEAKRREAFLLIASNLTQRETPEGWALERRMMPHINILGEHVKKGLEMDLVGTVNELADTYLAHGRYLEAQALFQRVLVDQERSLGMDHPSTLSTVHNMANVYQRQGEYTKALEWYQRALAGNEKSLGMDHPRTLHTVNNMAIVYKSQGEYTKALEWYQRALAGNERSLGMDHPNTLGTVHNMADVYQSQGEYTKALEWYQRALAGNEKSLGMDHPNTLSTVNNMAIVELNLQRASSTTFERSRANRGQIVLILFNLIYTTLAKRKG